MYFDFEPGKFIKIQSRDYRILSHPSVPMMAFGQEGRRAIVYQVAAADNGGKYALKIYKAAYRSKNIFEHSSILSQYRSQPGLAACNQKVVLRKTDPDLIQKYPEFEYAILMPWIDGATWYDIFYQKTRLSLSDSRAIAQNLSQVLCNLEQQGLAHCDLSGANTIVDFSDRKVSLIDFDEMFGSAFPKPIYSPRGSEGYSHKAQREQESWGFSADRFSGAILLVEMLIFSDDRARYSSYGESYFAQGEIHLPDTNRFLLAIQILREKGYTYAAELFKKAWNSNSLKDCPSLCEWNRALSGEKSIPVELAHNVNKRPSLEAKCTFIGQGSVGKTSIIRKIATGGFDPLERKTDGISVNQWQVANLEQTKEKSPEIHVNIWDFGGQEIMHATHQFFLTKRSLYLLVLDSRLTQEENRIEYWLKIIQSFGSESPILLIGNKIDQHPLDIDRTGLQKKYPNIVGILETSAATGEGIEALKEAITEQVNNLPHVRDLLPESWFTVKTKLEGLGQEENFITQDKYLELCAENEVSDETSQRTLIGFLHDLGVVLHFQDDPRLESLGILNPQWVTNGVYKILNSHELFKNKGVLERSMLNEILDAPEYPSNKRLFIVDMMRKFELCYDLVPDQKFLVPDLLPKDEPQLDFNGIPAFEYAYPVLPSSVITRFIVRMNQKIDDGFVWRTGVLLKIGENKALVKADIEDKKITIAIDGLEHTRRDALSAIRFQLDEIHASIKGLNPQKRVPVPNAPNADALEYDYLLMREREGQETHLVKDGPRLVKVSVREVLSGIESEAKRREQGGTVTNIFIGGNVEGSNIVSGDNNVITQRIQDSFNKADKADIQAELKETLKELAEAVAEMNKELPAEQASEAADDLEKLVEEATKLKPNKKWYSVSIEGLIAAAENLDKLGEPVVSLSKKVLSLLTGGLVK